MATSDDAVRRLFVAAVSDLSDRPTAVNVARYLRASAALELLRDGQKVDLIFSDIMMPDGMDGLGLAEILKTEFPDVPILLTSGYSDVAADAVTKGFQVIRKPYRMEELGMWFRTLPGRRST